MKNVCLQLVKKDTKTYTINIDNNGVAVDISGWSLYFTVKRNFEDTDEDAIISKDVTFPSNAESQAGIGYLTLTSSDTDVELGNFYYDMKFIDTNYRETFLSGKYNIVPSLRLG